MPVVMSILSTIGIAALAGLLDQDLVRADTPAGRPGVLRSTHFPAKAKQVIYLHMVGGPAQMDLYDYKPVMRDWYDRDYYAASQYRNPRGPASGTEKVLRGGSWLCTESYCQGYRVAARNATLPDSSLPHVGFRCVRNE